MIRLFLFGLLLLLPTGCWDSEEVNNVGFIIAAGIDRTKDAGIDLTIQVFIPNPTAAGTTDGGGGGGEGRVFTISTSGNTMPEALSALQKRSPRTLSWDHTKVFIFGEALARQGMKDELDYLFRSTEPRKQAVLFVSKGTGGQLLESLNDPNSYDTINRLAEMPSNRMYTMIYVEESIVAESGAFVLPVADLLPMNANGSAQKKALSVDGIAVFKHKKLHGFLNEKSKRGYQLGFQWSKQMDTGRNITITRNENGGKVTLQLVKSKLKLLPALDDGKWKMKVRLHVTADVVQNSTTIDLMSAADNMRTIEKLFNEEIKGVLQVTLNQVQKEMNADVIGFARAFHKGYPREWEKVKGEWDSIFPKIEFELEVENKIRTPGSANVNVLSNGNERKEGNG
jgi:spore germination protein KC